MNATLVIMAAGLGSRYGGEKQTDGVGPSGELLMEYSVYDAVRAGFDKVVFIVKPGMDVKLNKLCGERFENRKLPDGRPLVTEYVFQDFSDVPDFYKTPPERTKPFGTVHATYCARNAVKTPFAVINADDYYGVKAFKTMYDSLAGLKAQGEASMIAYKLKNTVSPNGTVTRGVCATDSGKLTKVTETYKIKLFPNGGIKDTASAPEGIDLDPESLVSMNFWGFTPWIFGKAEEYFFDYLKGPALTDINCECLLPMLADSLISRGLLSVSVLSTESSWFGMTYKEDRKSTEKTLKKLHKDGIYPAVLV
ncbi:MAG: hypothetical protein FWG32_03665 [Oscillospiraceae bacterium]|nr:hypothetical protein [Oscillospiraceae bacterium]